MRSGSAWPTAEHCGTAGTLQECAAAVPGPLLNTVTAGTLQGCAAAAPGPLLHTVRAQNHSRGIRCRAVLQSIGIVKGRGVCLSLAGRSALTPPSETRGEGRSGVTAGQCPTQTYRAGFPSRPRPIVCLCGALNGAGRSRGVFDVSASRRGARMFTLYTAWEVHGMLWHGCRRERWGRHIPQHFLKLTLHFTGVAFMGASITGESGETYPPGF